MKSTHLGSPALLALATAILFGLSSEAQEGSTSTPTTRPATNAGPSQRARETPSRPEMPLSADILPARFQAAIYEVQGPVGGLSRLDNKVLSSQAATPETLLSALTQTGKARLLYRFEEPVNVFSSRITVAVSEPIVTGLRTTDSGQTLNNISYQNVGVVVLLSAQASPRAGKKEAPIVTAAIKLSVLSPGEKEIAPGQKAVAMRLVPLDHSAALELNRPQVVLALSSNAFSSLRRSADGSRLGETPIATAAYVIRYQFSPLAQGSAASTSAGSTRSAPLESKPVETTTGAAEPASPTNTLTARLQATVYEVAAVTNRLPALDVAALENASTDERMLQNLKEAGKPRVLYDIDKLVNVFSDQVMIMTNIPMVTAVRPGSDGEALKSYTYSNRGLRIGLSAKAPPKEAKRKGPDLTVSFNLAGEAASDTELGLGEPCVSCPVIAQEHSEPLELGRSRVMLAMGSASASGRAKPFIYVIRYQFSPAK